MGLQNASNVISEVPNSDNYLNDTVPDMCVQEESYLEQLIFNPNLDIDITNDSNIILYEQYLQETESAAVENNTSSNQQNAMIMSVFDALSDQVAKCTVDNLKHKELDESLTAELESYKERVKQFEERQNVNLNNHEKYIESQMNDMILSKNAKFAAFQKEIDTLKYTLSKHEKENASLITKIDALKKQSKEKEDKKYFEIEKNELVLKHERLLKHIICQDVK
ncbi:hypothetical protein Tco_1290597, partial [Tanacetum coccineum]